MTAPRRRKAGSASAPPVVKGLGAARMYLLICVTYVKEEKKEPCSIVCKAEFVLSKEYQTIRGKVG